MQVSWETQLLICVISCRYIEVHVQAVEMGDCHYPTLGELALRYPPEEQG